MQLTLTDIKAHKPCPEGWKVLLGGLGKRRADREPLTLIQVLETNGVEDAVWCLRALPPSEEPRIRMFVTAVCRALLPQVAENARHNAERLIDWFERGAPDNERQTMRDGDETVVRLNCATPFMVRNLIEFLTATQPLSNIAQYVVYHALRSCLVDITPIFKEHFQ